MTNWFQWGLPDFDLKTTTDIPDPIIQHYHKIVRTYLDPRDKNNQTYKTEPVSNTCFTLIVHLYQLSKTTPSPNLNELARRMNYSTPQGVRYIIRTLEAMGLLDVTLQKGKESLYDFGELSRAVMIIELEERLAALQAKPDKNKMDNLSAMALEATIEALQDGNFDPFDPPTNVRGLDYDQNDPLTNVRDSSSDPPTNVRGLDSDPLTNVRDSSRDPLTFVEGGAKQMYRGSDSSSSSSIDKHADEFEELLALYKKYVDPLPIPSHQQLIKNWLVNLDTPAEEWPGMWVRYAIMESKKYSERTRRKKTMGYLKSVISNITDIGSLTAHSGMTVPALLAYLYPDDHPVQAQTKQPPAPASEPEPWPAVAEIEPEPELEEGAEVWEYLRESMAVYRPFYQLFEKTSFLRVESDTIVISVETEQAKQWLTARWKEPVESQLRIVSNGEVTKVHFVLADALIPANDVSRQTFTTQKEVL